MHRDIFLSYKNLYQYFFFIYSHNPIFLRNWQVLILWTVIILLLLKIFDKKKFLKFQGNYWICDQSNMQSGTQNALQKDHCEKRRWCWGSSHSVERFKKQIRGFRWRWNCKKIIFDNTYVVSTSTQNLLLYFRLYTWHHFYQLDPKMLLSTWARKVMNCWCEIIPKS